MKLSRIMKRKAVAILLLLSLLFGLFALSGCQVAPPSDEPPSDEPPTDDLPGEDDDTPLTVPGIDNPEKYSYFRVSEEKLDYAISEALKKVDLSVSMYGTDKFPKNLAKDAPYAARDNTAGWWQGFWTGMLWHAYEMTDDAKYYAVASQHVNSFYQRIYQQLGVDNHDMGFLYSLSCVAAYKLYGDEVAKQAALMAADHLITRYNEKPGFIQAWGSVGDESENRLIIDCLMNIPLLYWATEVTGEEKYAEMAYQHFLTTAEHAYRDDSSTYHTYFFDSETGAPLRGETKQGAGDETAWSRGQAWGIYGPMLTYVYKKDDKSLEVFKNAANYYLNNIPADYVAYWDLIYNDGDYQPKDSSAAAIAACAFLESAKHLGEDDPYREIYISAAHRIMNSLIDNYMATDMPEVNGILLHGTNSKTTGIDHMQIWGDYFFLEALHRLKDADWGLYW